MPPLPSVLPMMATTRSASMTPSSMSLASSDASLTLCSGTLRTSIGAGIAFLLDGGENGAGVVTGDGVGDVLERGDDGARAASLDETERGLDLGAHAAERELPCRGVLPQLRGGDAAQRTGRRCPEVDHHVRDVGGDHQGDGVDLRGQDGGGQVLVDDCLDATQRVPVLLVVDDGDAATAGADDDETGCGERVDGGGVQDGQRLGRGDDAAPATLAPVLPDLAERDEPFRLLAREEPADGLRGLLEGRVVGG